MKKVSSVCNAHSRNDFDENLMMKRQNTNKVRGSWVPKPMGAAPGTLIEEGAMKHVKLVTENLPEGTVLRLERNDAEGDIEWYDIVQPEIGKRLTLQLK